MPGNRFGGSLIESPEGAVSFGPVMSTKMACLPGEAEQEFAFLQALDETTELKVANGKLMLVNESGRSLLIFVAAEGDGGLAA